MKKFTLLFSFCIFALFVFAQPYTFTATSSNQMSWTDAATWTITGGTPGYDYPQTSVDIVIIDGYVILDKNNLTVASITVNNNTSDQLGTLTIEANTISTTGDFSLLGFSVGWGTIFVNNGTINSGGAFIFNKGSLTLTSCTINVSDYYSHEEGTMTASAEVNINISTGGTRNDDTTPSVFFGLGAIVTLNSSNVVISLQDLNTGTAPEIFANAFTVDGTGGIVESVINNISNISNDICYIISDAEFILLDLNLNNDIASGNSIECSTINAGLSFTVEDLVLSNSLMYTVPTTHFAILNSLSLNTTSELIVNGNFTSTATNDLNVDGILSSNSVFSLQSSNIVGNGTVYANTYSVGSNTVYGIPQANLTVDSYFSASTWYGSAGDGNWFTPGNWQTIAVPSSNTDVTIWSGAPNFPVIDATGATAKNFIIDAGTSLTINNQGDFTSATGIQFINNSGILTIDGGTFDFSGGIQAINNAASAINITNGGQMTITLDQSATARKMDNLGAINLDNNSTLTITGSLEMGSSSSLDVQGGSSVEIKQ